MSLEANPSRTPLMNQALQGVQESGPGHFIEKILAIVEDTDANERASVFENAQKLIRKGMNPLLVRQTCDMVKAVGPGEREGFVQSILRIMPDDAADYLIGNILSKLIRAPEEERSSIVEGTQKLIPEKAQGYLVENILSTVAKIPQAKRDDVVDDSLARIRREAGRFEGMLQGNKIQEILREESRKSKS